MRMTCPAYICTVYKLTSTSRQGLCSLCSQMFTAMCLLLGDAQIPVRRAARAGLVRTRERMRRRAHAAPRRRQDPQAAHAAQNPVRRGQRA